MSVSPIQLMQVNGRRGMALLPRCHAWGGWGWLQTTWPGPSIFFEYGVCGTAMSRRIILSLGVFTALWQIISKVPLSRLWSWTAQSVSQNTRRSQVIADHSMLRRKFCHTQLDAALCTLNRLMAMSGQLALCLEFSIQSNGTEHMLLNNEETQWKWAPDLVTYTASSNTIEWPTEWLRQDASIIVHIDRIPKALKTSRKIAMKTINMKAQTKQNEEDSKRIPDSDSKGRRRCKPHLVIWIWGLGSVELGLCAEPSALWRWDHDRPAGPKGRHHHVRSHFNTFQYISIHFIVISY